MEDVVGLARLDLQVPSIGREKSVAEGVFDNGLKQQARNGNRTKTGWNVDMRLDPVRKAESIQLDIPRHEIDLMCQRHHGSIDMGVGQAKQIPKMGHRWGSRTAFVPWPKERQRRPMHDLGDPGCRDRASETAPEGDVPERARQSRIGGRPTGRRHTFRVVSRGALGTARKNVRGTAATQATYIRNGS